jgi:hypothetical protein
MQPTEDLGIFEIFRALIAALSVINCIPVYFLDATRLHQQKIIYTLAFWVSTSVRRICFEKLSPEL